MDGNGLPILKKNFENRKIARNFQRRRKPKAAVSPAELGWHFGVSDAAICLVGCYPSQKKKGLKHPKVHPH